MQTHSSPDCVLAVDLGTGGPKVALVTAQGDVLGHEFEPTSVLLLDGGGAEQDPEEWWTAICAASRRLLCIPGLDASVVAGVCLTGQWSGTVPVDETGRHLHNALTWLDSRGEKLVKELVGGGVEVPGTGYNARKLSSWLRRNGGVPTLSGKDPVGHAQWLRQHRPEVYRASAALLDVPEYLTTRAIGQLVAAADTATSRWCTDNRDLTQIRYDDQLVDACGLDRSKLPPIVPSASIAGLLTEQAAEDLGLLAGVPVVVGTGDTQAAAVGAGAVEDYQAYLYVGTSAWVSAHVPFKKTDALKAIMTLPSVVQDKYWIACVQDVAGKAISWAIDNVFWPDPLSGPEDPFAWLNELAQQAPAGSNGALFFPWLNGERTPVEDDNLRGGWTNLSLTTDQPCLMRSVLEGVALNTRWMFEEVRRFAGTEGAQHFETLRFVGGGAQSALLCQIMSDVLNVRIEQVHEPMLANVRGAGLVGHVGLGNVTWAQIPERVKIAAEFLPRAENRNVYDTSYAHFRSYHKRSKRWYASVNAR